MDQKEIQLKALVEKYRQDMLDFWKELIDFQAGSREKERMQTLMEKVAARLEKEGMETELLDTGAVPLLQAWVGKNRPGKPILLSGHLDTVFPNGSYPEEAFTLKDGKAYGPGVCDMKGGIVMAVYVAKILTEAGYDQHPLKLVFVPDEEITHQGSRVADMLVEQSKGCLCAFNFETGRMDNCLTVGRKGCMDVWITVHGKAGHVGNAYATSANAIEEMAHKIIALRALTDLEKGRIVSTDIISGGTVSNAVADTCRIEVDCRYDYNEDKDRLQETIRALCAETHVPGTSTEVEFPASMPVFERTEGNDRLLALVNQVAADFGIPAFGAAHPGGCSDASFMAQAGIPILDSVGVQGDGAHTLQEYAIVETMFERTLLLAVAICRL